MSHDYFATVGAQLREGRFFDSAGSKSDRPLVVNEPFANRHFRGGRRSDRGSNSERLGDKGYWYTIVGVVNRFRERGVLKK